MMAEKSSPLLSSAASTRWTMKILSYNTVLHLLGVTIAGASRSAICTYLQFAADRFEVHLWIASNIVAFQRSMQSGVYWTLDSSYILRDPHVLADTQ